MTRSVHHALICAAAAAILAGCENNAKRTSDLPEPLSSPVVKGPLTPAEAQREDLSKAAIDLQSALKDMDAKQGSDASVDRPAPPPAEYKPQSRARDKKSAGPLELAANEPVALPDSSIPNRVNAKSKGGKGTPDDRTASQRKQDAITELANQLKPGIDGARFPMRAAMPLVALESISPGAAANDLDTVLRAISPDQRKTVGITRDLLRTLANDPDLATGESGAMARVLREKADQLAPAAAEEGFSLGSVVLCQRVDGFGRFTPMGVSTFVAGRPTAMIVYTEVENFAQKRSQEPGVSSTDSGEKWRVELGQTVRLYLDSDGSEQLTLPESLVRDESVSRRHDFFLVQRLDLPRNLSVGTYNLKVAVRDIPSNSLAERVIPIRIVADPSAIRESVRGSNSGQLGKTESNGRFADSVK